MTNIRLSKRLSEIANLVNKDSVLVDIGCDHALLDIYLLQNNIIKKAYACDVASGALKQAKKNIELYKIKNIETRLGDGLNVINEKDIFNTIVISGLGNQKILEILGEDKNKLKCAESVIIQSNTKVSEVRKGITKLGFFIENEKLVEERDIIYTIIKFAKGIKKYNKRQLLFGPELLKNKDKLFYKLIEQDLESNKRILQNMPKKLIFKRLNIQKKIRFLRKEKSAT